MSSYREATETEELVDINLVKGSEKTTAGTKQSNFLVQYNLNYPLLDGEKCSDK